MMTPIQPQTKEIDGKTFVLTKFPAIAGREIVSQYVASGIPKVGDYGRNEALMVKLMGYVGVVHANMEKPLFLTTRELIDNHVGDWETLAKVEIAMMEYNCSFFRNGRASTFFEGIAQKIQEWILKTLTPSSQQLSPTEKQPSTSSEPSTA